VRHAGGGRRRGVRSLGVPASLPGRVIQAGRPGARRLEAVAALFRVVLSAALAIAFVVSLPVVAPATEPGASPFDAPGAAWRVVLVDVETGAELWSAPVAPGDAIWYAYVHSADKTPVESLLRVSPPEGLVLELERYLWYGAGLEYRSDRGVVLDGEWVVVNAERVIGRLILRVAGTVEQTIRLGEETVALGQLAAYGRRVALEVRP